MALAAGALMFALRAPYAGFDQPVLVDIERGTPGGRLAEILEERGVVRHRWLFQAARGVRMGARIQAGEYRFAGKDSAWTVLDRLVRGDVHYYEVTIPEGSNLFDIARRVEATGLMASDAFLAAARDPALVRDLDPEARTLEGYLFPATYRITRHTSAAQFCRDMTQRFRRALHSLGIPAGEVARMVTLASLVEKETAVPAERPLVASVYTNRLRRHMRLECDPTTIYAALLEGRYRGVIHRSDLDSKHPYNTYQNAGLPPGPIANPGLEALRAAWQPAGTEYLFFVARPDGSGGHVFSEGIAAHNRAVADYRRGQKVQQASASGGVARRGAAGRH